MSQRPGEAGRGGKGGRGGRGGGRGGRGKPKHRSKTVAIQDDIFDFGRPECAATFEKSRKAFIEYIRRCGKGENVIVANGLEKGVTPIIPIPEKPPRIEDPNNRGQVPPSMIEDEARMILWHGAMKMIPKREYQLEETLVSAFSTLFDQCTLPLRGKLEQLDEWASIKATQDPVRLLGEIRSIVCGRESHMEPLHSMAQLMKGLILYTQDPSMSNERYKETFEGIWEALVQQGGDITNHPGLINPQAEIIADRIGRPRSQRPHPDDIAAAKKHVSEGLKARFMLSGADNRRHRRLKEHCEDSFTMGRNEYPANTTALLSMLNNFRQQEPRKQSSQPVAQDADEGVNFAQEGDHDDVDATDGVQMLIEGTEIQEAETMDSGAGTKAKRHRKKKSKKKKKKSDDGSGESVAEKSAGVDATNTTSDETLICVHCGSKDHDLAGCPGITDEELSEILIQLSEEQGDEGNILIQGSDGDSEEPRKKIAGLDPHRLYLDTCTTNDQMVNGSYLRDTYKVEKPLRMHTNAGSSQTDTKGRLGNLTFWLNRYGIANVVSLRTLENHFHVTYDSKKDGGQFICETPRGQITFKRCGRTGFPYIDLTDHEDDGAIIMVQTVRRNFEGFTRKEVERAIAARKAQALAGHPSERVFKHEVSRKSENSLFKSCPVSVADIDNARTIFGPSAACARGKWVRRKSARVDPDYVSIPATVIDSKYITLAADVMFVCGLPFLISISRKIRFITVQYVPRRTAIQLANGLLKIQQLYQRAGFVVQTVLMDGEFEKVREHTQDKFTLNICSHNEHVPEIERKIKQVKERCRCDMSEIGIPVLPNIIVKHLVIRAVMFLNCYIDAQGISTVYSPRELVLRWNLDFKKHCRAQFGAYCLVYDEPDPNATNTMASRTRNCICLGPTGNFQGTHNFLCLASKSVIKRRRFEEFPMPDSVIKQLTQWGRQDRQNGQLTFANRNNDPFEWNDEYEMRPLVEDNAVETPPATLPYPDIPGEPPGIQRGNPEGNTNTTDDTNNTDQEEVEAQRTAAAIENANFGPRERALIGQSQSAGVHTSMETQPSLTTYESTYNILNSINMGGTPMVMDQNANQGQGAETFHDAVENQESSDDDDDDDTYSEESDDTDDEIEQYTIPENEALREARETTRSGRVVRPPRRYEGVGNMNVAMLSGLDHTASSTVREEELPYLGIMMTQLSLKKGLRVFGKRGEESALKEMQQLYDMDTFFPRDPKSLTRDERAKALSSLIFLKQKSNGDIKGRTCVNGAPQRAYIKKEDAASPTAMTDSVFITGAIDAFEGREVAKCDLPGAFLHTKTDEKVIMTLRGELCDLMVKINPSLYRKHVTKDRKGNPVLYVELYKSLYGLMRSALLFYRKLRGELERYGFIFNPYDPCVANCTAKDGNQLTVVFHVDDLKISCKNGLEITKLLYHLKGIYGTKITIERSKKFEFLGMDLDFTEPGVFGVSMVPFIDKILDDWPEQVTKSSACPHNANLFRVREESEATFLPEDQAIKFHHTIAQLVWLQKRARRDIQVATSFLSSRVKRPDEDDWGKCRRILQYLKGSRNLKLRIKINDINEIKWIVDASHNVHWDCKGQTGAGMTMGEGAIISSSNKQKINTKSACESELVGIDDAIPTMLWSLYFIQAQGIDTKRIRLYQDNKSTILLASHGQMSSSKRTKHIKAKFFFIADKVSAGEIAIEHMPTEDVWIDVNTKPNEGRRFRVDRSKIMNCSIDIPDETLNGRVEGSGVDDEPPMTTGSKGRSAPDHRSAKCRAQECVGSQTPFCGGNRVTGQPPIIRAAAT